MQRSRKIWPTIRIKNSLIEPEIIEMVELTDENIWKANTKMLSIRIYLTDLKQLLSAAEVPSTETRKKRPPAFCLSELWQPRMNREIQGRGNMERIFAIQKWPWEQWKNLFYSKGLKILVDKRSVRKLFPYSLLFDWFHILNLKG